MSVPCWPVPLKSFTFLFKAASWLLFVYLHKLYQFLMSFSSLISQPARTRLSGLLAQQPQTLCDAAILRLGTCSQLHLQFWTPKHGNGQNPCRHIRLLDFAPCYMDCGGNPMRAAEATPAAYFGVSVGPLRTNFQACCTVDMLSTWQSLPSHMQPVTSRCSWRTQPILSSVKSYLTPTRFTRFNVRHNCLRGL